MAARDTETNNAWIPTSDESFYPETLSWPLTFHTNSHMLPLLYQNLFTLTICLNFSSRFYKAGPLPAAHTSSSQPLTSSHPADYLHVSLSPSALSLSISSSPKLLTPRWGYLTSWEVPPHSWLPDMLDHPYCHHSTRGTSRICKLTLLLNGTLFMH